ncbi:hypothetical protein [Bacillus sp. T33-2]|uniref:hypothetical protein n=1 Tax=Bacillus sp. T33-2 TaxID=2054168 RepID=UPI000C75EB52|nr:hypothetical protein [Bacillus sp. T33-2]PLR99534.1 hypothetical protein CVD19_00290 [Bacillus sp. T33-2]
MINIAKTELTIELERKIWEATNKQGTFGCFEVTIGWFGEERVDYITYDTKGIWRCCEIKVSKADFYSKAKKTFVGHFNYFVMPKELYEEVKEDIPAHVGVYIGNYSIKKAKKQYLTVDEQVLKDSLIRSLSREFSKQYKSGNPNVIDNMNRQINRHQAEAKRYKGYYYELTNKLFRKYGRNWQDIIE